MFDSKVCDAILVIYRQRWISRTFVDANLDNRGVDEDFQVRINRNLNDHDLSGDEKITIVINEAMQTLEDKLRPDLPSDKP